MSPNLFHRRRAERFAQLLDEAGGMPRRHVRSRLDAQLSELVAIGHQASALRPTAELDPEFRTGLRAMLVATAERDGIGRTASDPAEAELATAARRSPVSGRPSRVRARGAVIVGVAVGAIAVSGMSAASESAVPGDALYSVKRSTERAQLALASSDVTRGQLYLDFAHTRVAEAAAVRRDPAGFASVLDDMDVDTRQGVRLLTTSAAVRRDPAALDVIGSFVTLQRLELGALLDAAPSANRARTLESLTLLDAVTKRADALRSALSCGDSPSAGSDRLGPKPRQCGAGSAPDTSGKDHATHDRTSGDREPTSRHTEAQITATRSPAVPAPTGAAAPRLEVPAPAPTPEPAEPVAPASDPTAEEDGVLGEVGRILGDLLG